MHVHTASCAYIFLAIVLAPASLMLLGQIAIKSYWRWLDR